MCMVAARLTGRDCVEIQGHSGNERSENSLSEYPNSSQDSCSHYAEIMTESLKESRVMRNINSAMDVWFCIGDLDSNQF